MFDYRSPWNRKAINQKKSPFAPDFLDIQHEQLAFQYQQPDAIHEEPIITKPKFKVEKKVMKMNQNIVPLVIKRDGVNYSAAKSIVVTKTPIVVKVDADVATTPIKKGLVIKKEYKPKE